MSMEAFNGCPCLGCVKCLKSSSYVILTALMITMVLSSVTSGFSLPLQSKTSISASSSQGLQVWFDTPYFLGAGPCDYQLVVHAKTSSGFEITNIHWDFGDGSTLDVPFIGESLVRDSQIHGYATAGTYIVAVTASDSGGNIGTGYWGLYDAFPTSCARALLQPTSSNPTISVSSLSINGLCVTVNAQAQAGNAHSSITSIFWAWGDGSWSTGSEGTHTYDSPITYTVTATAYESDGRTASASVTVTLTSQPTVVNQTGLQHPQILPSSQRTKD